MPKHLVWIEHDDKGIKKSSLVAIEAARKIGGDIHGVLLGSNLSHKSHELAYYVQHVHVGEHEGLNHKLAQPYAKVLADVAHKISASHVWAAASIAGKDLMPRVAIRLNAGMAADIQEIINDTTFIRPVWAGDINCEMQILTKIKVITVRVSEFTPASKLDTASPHITPIDIALEKVNMRFMAFDAVKSSRPELNDAEVVVSGGRGLKSPEGFKELIEPLADVLHAAIGASRAVCDAGWVPNDWQVGQTGKVVAPKLYIAVGISGAIQHVAGIKGSRVIVAINKDPDAPIFQIADYGLVADAYKAIPELITALKEKIL